MKATGVDRKILKNPVVRRELKDIARLASNINTKLENLEKLTGHDYSDIKFKRR